MRNDISGIYLISIGDVFYIGKSCGIHRRLYNHLRILRKGKHWNTYLQRAFNKYGETKYSTSVLEIASDNLCALEQQYIAEYKTNGFKLANATDGGDGGPGRIVSESTREKLRNNQLGKRYPPEVRANMSKGQLGRKHPDEVKEKISKAQTGKVLSDETKQKQGLAKAKYYDVVLIDPDGNEHIGIFNLSEFARQHNLQRQSICKLIDGTIKQTKGWKLKDDV